MAKESDLSFAKESTDVSFGKGLGGRDAYKIGAPARALPLTRHNLVLQQCHVQGIMHTSMIKHDFMDK